MAIGAPAPGRMTPLSFRKNASMLRGSQLAVFRRAMAASMATNDDRGWQNYAGLHGLPLPMYCQHHTALFLPWHRAYLYFLELSLKGFEPTASLPWWDWSSASSRRIGLPVAYTEATTPEGNPNPLASVVINSTARQQAGAGAPERTFREPDDPSRLPTPAAVEAILRLTDFVDFQQQLEQLHDYIHVWVGGSVGEVPFAAYDPIFFAHHVMVDRIWRLWQLRHPSSSLPASLLDEALPPFGMTVRQTLNVTPLGYDYASFSSRTMIGG